MASEDCAAVLRCPVCGAPMRVDSGSLRCVSRHTFDIAREGHVDLLPPGHGRHNIAGDTREMIAARTRVLESGLFDPLAECVTGLATTCLAKAVRLRSADGEARDTAVVLDCGCGTGYYLDRIARHFAQASSRTCLLGTDISSAALRRAARTLRNGLFFRNDIAHRISVVDRAADLIINIFAPRNSQEFHRILHPRGTLLIVIPGAGHLAQLRARLPILAIAPDKEERLMASMHPLFDLVQDRTVRYDRALDAVQLLDLLRMTPSAWHLQQDAWRQAALLPALDVTLDFHVLELRPTVSRGDRDGQ